jgi:hypothetical protein
MNQSSTSAKNTTVIQGVAVRSCELRLERCTVETDGTERVEFICGASGGPEHGYVLGRAGEDLSSMVAVCNTCPVPDALEARQSCLNLVPVRRFPGGKRSLPMYQPDRQPANPDEPVETYFPCRWFYTLYLQNQPRDTTVCRSCTYWFPRPPLELIPNYWPETQKMLRVVNGEESTTLPPTGIFRPASPRPPAKPWWQRLREKVHL